MKKHGTTIALFALASFYYLTTDVILNDEAAILLGQERVVPVYALAMLSLGAGFALFSFLHKKTSSALSRRLMLSVVLMSSVLFLFGFILVNNPVLFILLMVIHMLATGVIGGAAHFYAAMALRDRIYSGRVVGLAIGAAALMQVVLLTGTSSSLLRALFLTGILGIFSYLVFKKTPVAVVVLKSRQAPPVNPPAKSYLCSVVAIVAVISLMGGFNDGIITTMHTQKTVNIYTYPRLFYLAGVVAAGFIADIRARRYLPLVMLAVMMCSTVGVMFLDNPVTWFINACIFFLFAGFAIMYFTVTFFDIAPLTGNPMLWAGMGRITRFVFIAVGSVSSGYIFAALSFNTIIALYILLSVVLLVLFYLSGSFAVKKQTAAVSGRTKAEMMNRSKSFDFTRREAEILSYLIESAPTREIAESLNISERTVKFHVTNIFDKTGVKSRMELLVILSKDGE
jgi:DNA-binding CsgD family transcriptional regulator